MVARPHREADQSDREADTGVSTTGDDSHSGDRPAVNGSSAGDAATGATEAGPSAVAEVSSSDVGNDALSEDTMASSSEAAGQDGAATAVPVVPQSESGSNDAAQARAKRQSTGPRKPPRRISSIAQLSGSVYGPDVDTGFRWDEFMKSGLPQKLGVLLALIAFSRLGVYIRLPGVDVEGFAETMKSGGLLGYVDALSGGSISKVGLFSLGECQFVSIGKLGDPAQTRGSNINAW